MSTGTLDVIQLVLRVVLAVVFVGMGSLHFRPAAQLTMAAMIPPRLRFAGALNPRNLVIITGMCEVVGGVGLAVPGTAFAAAMCLVVFLAAVFPANAFAARNPRRFGRFAIPLVPRLVAQVVLAALLVLAVLPR